MGLCLLSLPISLVILRIRILYLIIIKSESWPICHCLGLDHETMVCAVCIFIFLQDYGMESISNRDAAVLHQAFQEMLNFVKSWIFTGFQLKAHKLFEK